MSDVQVLLKDKNQLNESRVDKYRLAGQISQTCLAYLTKLINESYHLGKTPPVSVNELCMLGDSYMQSALAGVFSKGENAVKEKGIAQPVTIEINDFVCGYSPELDQDETRYFQEGDIVSITLGTHIDGYTAHVSHTIVIYPAGETAPGPLLGAKADAICAAHIANESVVNLLAAALSPEKLPQVVSGSVTGCQIRQVVDAIADSYGCVVVPGSRVRRIRRFLAGQAEGVLAESDFKGVVWSEQDQELRLLSRCAAAANGELTKFDKLHAAANSTTSSSAVPSDDFTVTRGEVYVIDIKMASLAEFTQAGIVTLETLDKYTGKNNQKDAINVKPSIYVRDYSMEHQLKLKSSRTLLSKLDREMSVYPFKLSHTAPSFPVSTSKKNSKPVQEQLRNISEEVKSSRLGLQELTNRHLTVAKPIQAARFVDLETILKSANATGASGLDSEAMALPGLEVPLPRLGMSALKLKSLWRHYVAVPVAREMSTVVLKDELFRLTGGSKTSNPSWVHSQYTLAKEENIYIEAILQLATLAQDKRFGLRIKECKPFKLTQVGVEQMPESMEIE